MQEGRRERKKEGIILASRNKKNKKITNEIHNERIRDKEKNKTNEDNYAEKERRKINVKNE